MRQPVALWVIPVSNLAGVARHCLDVARHGLPGYSLAIACPKGPLLDELLALDCRVIPLDLEQGISASVKQVRSIVQELQPQIVHSHLAKADFLVTLGATSGRLISTEHHIPEDPLTFHGNQMKAYSRQLAHHVRIRRFSQLIAVSESTSRDMLKYWHPSAPITVVLNGVDRLSERPSRTPGLRFLSLTRLSQEKNLDMTLRIFAKVRETHPEATLTIGGTGEEEDNLKALAQELALDDSASFVGFVDPIEAMKNHDVLLQPSKADNLSYTLLDAVNYGMGVVASNIGGNGEIVAAQCRVSLGDIDRGAAIALEQAIDLQKRPSLPENIPSVGEMTSQIVVVYAKAQTTTPLRSRLFTAVKSLRTQVPR